jgi:hypothetical protein
MAQTCSAALVIFDRSSRYGDEERVVGDLLRRIGIVCPATGAVVKPGILQRRQEIYGLADEFFEPLLRGAYSRSTLNATPFEMADGTKGVVVHHL